LKTTNACGVSGTVILRADSAYYGRPVIAAARRGGAHFSITARKTRTVTAAIAAIQEHGWTRIRFPKAVSMNSFGSGCPEPKSPRLLHPFRVRR
jgi:hypothetical protein